MATATEESLDSFRIGRLFRLALPDYGVKMEERILVRSISDVYGDPRGVRLTLASNIRDTAEDLVRLDNTVTGGSSQNSTKSISAAAKAPVCRKHPCSICSKDRFLHERNGSMG